jgi:hypothetical protein
VIHLTRLHPSLNSTNFLSFSTTAVPTLLLDRLLVGSTAVHRVIHNWGMP